MVYRLLLVAATLIWGSSFIIVKDITDCIAVTWLLVLRFATAAVILAVLFFKKRELYLKKEYVGIGLLFGLVMFFAYYTQTIGITYTTPGKNAFLTGVYCVLVPFFAWAMTKSRPTKFNIAAAFLCIVGVGFISLGDESGINQGDLWTLLGAVFYAIHICLVSKFSQGRDIYVLTMWQFFGVALFALIASFATGSQVFDLASYDVSQLGSLAYLAVACTALALLFQNIGQKHCSAASASLLLSLESPFGVAFSVAFGAEVLTGKVAVGFALVFIAIIVSEVLPEKLAKR